MRLLYILLLTTACLASCETVPTPRSSSWPPPGYREVARTQAVQINPGAIGVKAWNAGFGTRNIVTGIMVKEDEPWPPVSTKGRKWLKARNIRVVSSGTRVYLKQK